jgi:cardiolipin synthase
VPSLAHLIPSSLSGARLLIGLAFPWIPTEWRLAAAITGGITDLIDGPISRWLRVDGRFGQLLDPIADKIFLASVLITVVIDGTLLWWEVLLIGGRDIAIFLGCVIVMLVHGWGTSQEMRPRLLGKATTALQTAFILALLADLQILTRVLFPATALVGMVAVVDYYATYLRPAAQEREDSANQSKMTPP